MPRSHAPIVLYTPKTLAPFDSKDGGWIFLAMNGIVFEVMGFMDLVCTHCNSSGVEVDDMVQGVCMATWWAGTPYGFLVRTPPALYCTVSRLVCEHGQ